MSRRAKLIAVGAGLLLAWVAGGIVLVLDDDDGGGGDGTVATAPAPLPTVPRPSGPESKRCPPPGPAAIDPHTGRTLCGDEAERFVEGEQRRRREQVNPPREMRRGRRIIAADPTLRTILRGHRHRIAQLGSWSAGSGTERLGVAANIELDEPIEVDAVVPYVCLGDPAKGEGRQRVRAGKVAQLHVLARFTTRRVAEISPETTVGGPPFSHYHAERLPGSPECPPSEYED